MILNIISIISFIIMILLNWGSKKFKYTPIVIQVFSIILFAYKSVFYIIQDLNGNISIPVEISSISYFLIPLILTFKIKKLYVVASFLGVASGLGFFLFYILIGFTVSTNFTIAEFLISVFSHSYLLTAGLQIMFRNRFVNKPQTIWLAMLGVICWSMAFYDFANRGLTFIYYIIKPSYLCVFSSNVLNIFSVIIFYAIVLVLFHFAVKLFFRVNNKINKNTTDFNEQCNITTSFIKQN